MGQVEVGTSIGYALKRVTWALRGSMDQALAGLELSVPQYSCLELLRQRPGISNSELARGTFTSRQASHQLLAGLRRAELVRDDGEGRGRRLTLTAHGHAVLTRASSAVAEVEQRMLGPLATPDRDALRALLESCADSLDHPSERLRRHPPM